MPLKIKLKAQEKVLIDSCILQNIGESRTSLLLLNNAVVLRERDVVKAENATTIAQKLQWAVAELYITDTSDIKWLNLICDLVGLYLREHRNASLEAVECVGDLCGSLAMGDYYRALKNTKELVRHEDSDAN